MQTIPEVTHFLEGANAWAKAAPRNANPYDHLSASGIAWFAGWDAAAVKSACAEQKEGPPW
jgi:hypothetical protein